MKYLGLSFIPIAFAMRLVQIEVDAALILLAALFPIAFIISLVYAMRLRTDYAYVHAVATGLLLTYDFAIIAIYLGGESYIWTILIPAYTVLVVIPLLMILGILLRKVSLLSFLIAAVRLIAAILNFLVLHSNYDQDLLAITPLAFLLHGIALMLS